MPVHPCLCSFAREIWLKNIFLCFVLYLIINFRMALRCRGARLTHRWPSRAAIPCTAGTDVHVDDCEFLNGKPNTPANAAQCRHFVCQLCVDAARNSLRGQENSDFQTRLIPLCMICQVYEAGRHPKGYKTCSCEHNLSMEQGTGYKCDLCRRRALDWVKLTLSLTEDWKLRIGRARGGRFVYRHAGFLNREAEPCPGCGRSIPEQWRRDNIDETVTFCQGCTGIIVKPTEEDHPRLHQNSRVAPRGAKKYPARAKERNATKPALEFYAEGQPFRW